MGAEFIIPSGAAFQELLLRGIERVHRDTFHASLGLGRYTLGLLWYKALTGRKIMDNSFCDFDEPVSAEEMRTAKQAVQDLTV